MSRFVTLPEPPPHRVRCSACGDIYRPGGHSRDTLCAACACADTTHDAGRSAHPSRDPFALALRNG